MNTQEAPPLGRLKQGATVATVIIAAAVAALAGAGGGVAITATALQDTTPRPQGEPGIQGRPDLEASRASAESAAPRASGVRLAQGDQRLRALPHSRTAHRLTLSLTAWLNS